MLSVYEVEQILRDAQEDDDTTEYFYDELPYVSKGDAIELPWPEGYSAEVAYANLEREYDSYGSAQSINNYLVFTVSNDTEQASFKLPGGYSSYEGTVWRIDELTQVVVAEKTILVWESV